MPLPLAYQMLIHVDSRTLPWMIGVASTRFGTGEKPSRRAVIFYVKTDEWGTIFVRIPLIPGEEIFQIIEDATQRGFRHLCERDGIAVRETKSPPDDEYFPPLRAVMERSEAV